MASSSLGSNDDIATNAEVSKYSFLNRLKHYMNGEKITSKNRKLVDFAILFEIETAVRNIDCIEERQTRGSIL